MSITILSHPRSRLSGCEITMQYIQRVSAKQCNKTFVAESRGNKQWELAVGLSPNFFVTLAFFFWCIVFRTWRNQKWTNRHENKGAKTPKRDGNRWVLCVSTYPDNVFILDSKARWRITMRVRHVPMSLDPPAKRIRVIIHQSFHRYWRTVIQKGKYVHQFKLMEA